MDRETFLRVFNAESSETVPVFLFDYTLGMEAAGYGTSEIFTPTFDGVKGGKSILALRRYTEHDASIGCPFAFDLRLFGGEMRYKDDDTPTTMRCPFSEPEKLYECDLNKATSIVNEQIKSYEYINSKDPDFVMGCPISSPHSLGCQLRGYEPFIMDVILEPDYIRDLVKFTSDYFMTITPEILDTGLADFVMLSSAYETAEVFGSEFYRNDVLPLFRPFIELSHSYDIPIGTHPHGCFTEGKGIEDLEYVLELGVQSLYYGENNDMRKLRELCDSRVSVTGGIDSFTTIYLGDKERIEKDVNACLDAFEGVPYILSCSCSVDRFLQLDKVKMMVDAVRTRERRFLS